MACILIVEDNPANRKLARLVLESAGHGVLEAGSADEALDWMSRQRPDLILMDVQLPGMDGLSLSRQLKADAAWSACPIIAVTAFAMPGDAERTLAAGCDAYVSKPLRYRELLALVDGLLSR